MSEVLGGDGRARYWAGAGGQVQLLGAELQGACPLFWHSVGLGTALPAGGRGGLA